MSAIWRWERHVCVACVMCAKTQHFVQTWHRHSGKHTAKLQCAIVPPQKRSRLCCSYLDVFPHAAGQHSHQYRYCGMSHFLAVFCLFSWRSCYCRITASNIRCLVTSAEVMDTDCVRRRLPARSPASASCSLLPTGSPMAAWDFLWMKSDRTKPCFCGYLSQTSLVASSPWLSE